MSARLEALLLDVAVTVLELREPAASVYVRIAAQHGILRSIRDVARALRSAIVSNMDARLPALLEGLGLAGAFDAIVLPSSCGLAKPDPRIFAFALAALGVPAGAALYVGDREPDCVAAARAAGLRAWRYDPRARAGTPDVLSDWAELESCL